ncbi:MAG: hypothetical protein LBJ09_00585 [Clostridiales bacterium]|nr:hypothetical protein [Clostridiales bacterium]
MSATESIVEKYGIKNLSDLEELIENTEFEIDSLGEEAENYPEMEKFLSNLYKLRLKLEKENASPEAPPESTDAETSSVWENETAPPEASPESEEIVLESPAESAESKTFSIEEVNLETYPTCESKIASSEVPPVAPPAIENFRTKEEFQTLIRECAKQEEPVDWSVVDSSDELRRCSVDTLETYLAYSEVMDFKIDRILKHENENDLELLYTYFGRLIELIFEQLKCIEHTFEQRERMVCILGRCECIRSTFEQTKCTEYKKLLRDEIGRTRFFRDLNERCQIVRATNR